MTLRIKAENTPRSTRLWSCSTLGDGIDALLSEASKMESEEDELLKMIQDCSGLPIHSSVAKSSLNSVLIWHP